MGRPRKFATPEILQDLIDKYFADCDEKKKPYTITGLALALDTTRETLLDYRNKSEFAEYSDSIKKAKQKCQNYAEECLFAGKNVAGVIFNMKNNYKWVDKQEVAVSDTTYNTLLSRAKDIEGSSTGD